MVAEAAVRVKVQGGTPPTLTFVGARERTVLVADGVEVDARGVATSCDGRPMSGRAVSYAWDVVDAVTGARLPLASSSRDARKFAAGAGALAPVCRGDGRVRSRGARAPARRVS